MNTSSNDLPKVCPICNKPLQVNPITWDLVCFLHGDYHIEYDENENIIGKTWVSANIVRSK